MIDQETWLRAELERSVQSVRPAPDPMGRLLARQRRRRFGRWASGVAAVLVVALTGGTLALSGGPGPGPDLQPPETTQIMVNEEITSPWTRELLAAPTRGNLAGDQALVADLTRQLSDGRAQYRIDPALDRVKVLVLAQTAEARIAVVSYFNDDRARLVELSAPAGTSTSQLASGEFGSAVYGLTPFPVLRGGVSASGRAPYTYVVALAPPSCQIATSSEASFGPGGTVTQRWQDQGDLVVRSGPDNAGWWRFTCGGVVRSIQSGTTTTPQPVAGTPALERGQVDPALVTRALAEWRSLPGLPVSRHRALWGGTIPGTTTPAVVIAGEAPTGEVQVCALVGTGEPTYLVSAVPGRALDLAGGKPLDPSVTGAAVVVTGVAPSADLVAVRLPEPTNPFVLSDRLLVIGPATATQLRVSGGAPVPLAGGVAVISAKIPAGVTLTAVDGAGATVGTLTLAEPDADGYLFNQPLLQGF